MYKFLATNILVNVQKQSNKNDISLASTLHRYKFFKCTVSFKKTILYLTDCFEEMVYTYKYVLSTSNLPKIHLILKDNHFF